MPSGEYKKVHLPSGEYGHSNKQIFMQKSFFYTIFIFFVSFVAHKNQAAAQTKKRIFTQNSQNWLATLQKATPKEVEKWWEKRAKHNEIPYSEGDSVMLLYKEESKSTKSVSWAGDFTGWQPSLKGTQIGNSGIWYCKLSLPVDARIDYKIVLNDNNWLLDSANPHQQWAGVGGGQPNSELRMPAWKAEPWAEKKLKQATKMGKLSANILINSTFLGYEVQYKVYLPNNYEKLQNLPVVYLTDGQEYGDDRMGGVKITLDNLIAANKISPVIAVFIDPRQPDKLENNRRADEFLKNDKFLAFVSKELVAQIDKNYKTAANADSRAFVGTSYGGFCSTYFAAKANTTFQLFAINSPAYWVDLQVFENFKTTKLPIKKLFLSTGLIFDGQEQSKQFKAILDTQGYEFRYKEVNQGHSWGNWKGLAATWLLYFFGK